MLETDPTDTETLNLRLVLYDYMIVSNGKEDCGTVELYASDLETVFTPWLDNATTHIKNNSIKDVMFLGFS